MELRVLKYFLAVVREENILRAAETLHVAQPSLSRQLAQLEEELGAKLFIRGNRKVSLTDAGMLLRRRAEEIISLADKTEKEFLDFGGGEDIEGTVGFGAGEIKAVEKLAKIMTEFNKKYPKIKFGFYSGNADYIKEQLDNGLLDFGLLLEPVDFEKYDFVSMGVDENWVALMRPDSPLAQKEYVTAEDLKDQRLILPTRAIVRKKLANWFGDDFDESNVVVTNNLINNGALMVEQGLGYAIGTECVPALYDPQRFCYRKLYPELTTGSVLVWKKYQPFGNAAAMFLNFLRISQKHM